MHRLLINGTYIDLVGGSSSLYIEANDVLNYAPGKSIKTKTLRIARTKDSETALSNVFDRRSEINSIYQNVVYENQNIRYFGQLQITGVKDNIAEGVFTAGNGTFALDFANTRLPDLDYSLDFNHILTLNEVLNSEVFGDGRLYIYDVVDRGRFIDGKKLNLMERFPAVNYRALILKALEGWKVTFGDDSDEFKRKYIMFTRSSNVNNSEEWATDSLFEAKKTAATSAQVQLNAPGELDLTYFVPFDDIVVNNGGNLISSQFAVTEDGNYRLRGRLSGFFQKFSDAAPLPVVDGLTARFSIVNTVNLAEVFYRELSFNDDQTVPFDITLDTQFIKLEAGSNYALRIFIFGNVTSFGGSQATFRVTVDDASEYFNQTSRWFWPGQEVDFKKIVPDVEINTFIRDFMRDFAQQMFVNPITKEIWFLPVGKAFTPVDITTKVSGVDYEITERTSVVLQIPADNSDVFQQGKSYAAINRVADSQQTQTVSLSYSPTVTDPIFRLGIDVPLPYMWSSGDPAGYIQYYSDEQLPEFNTIFGKRILFYAGQETTDYTLTHYADDPGGETESSIKSVPVFSMEYNGKSLAPVEMFEQHHNAVVRRIRGDRVNVDVVFDAADYLPLLYTEVDKGLQVPLLIRRGQDSMLVEIVSIESSGLRSTIRGVRLPLNPDAFTVTGFEGTLSVSGGSGSGSSGGKIPTGEVLHDVDDSKFHKPAELENWGKIVRANPDNGRIEFDDETDPVFVAWRDADRAINQVYASPASGSPGVAGFRALVASDLAEKIISYAKIQDVTALSVLGRASNTDGVIAPITAATDHHVLRRSGNTIGFGALTSANMPAYLPPASATTSQTLRYDGTNWVATDGLTVSAAGQVVTKRATNEYVGLITALTGAAGNVVAFEMAAHVAGGLASLNARDGLDLLFAVNNVEAFRIVNSNRRVGFGTPDPTRLLDVNGNLRVRTIADVRTVSSNHGAFLVARQSGTNVGDVDCIVANQSGLVRWTAGSGWSFDNAAYLTSFTETDPTVPSWVKAITEIQITNWGEAYSWGDHSLVGYIKGSVSSGYIPKANSLGVLENSKVFQDSSNNVGVNTIDPSAQFHVASGTKPTSGSAYSTVAQEVSTTDTTDPYRVRYGFNMTADGANKEHSFAYLLATEGGSTQIPFVVHAKYFGIGAYTTSIGSTRFPTSKLSILLNSALATDTTESALKVSTNDSSPLDFHLRYKGHSSQAYQRGYIITAPALRLATTVIVGASSTNINNISRGTLNVGEMEVTEGSPRGWSLLVSGAAYIGNYSGSDYQTMSSTGAQALNVRGAIKIDNSTVASYGSIRYTGSDYQGYMPNDGSGSPGWVSLTSGSGGGGTGAETFIALNDTPAAYSSAGQYVRINSGNNGLEFGALPTATTSVAGIVTVGSTLAVASGVINYNLPTATGSVLGGIKVGSRLTITDGVLSADVQIPSTLGGLSDVTISSPTNGQFLRYTDGVWYNVDFSGTGGSYVSWNIAASGTSGVASVSDAETVTFIAGTNIGITRAGREITINNAASVYSNWNLSASGTAGSEIISSGDNVLFQSGSNVTITRSGKTITISATAGGTGATTLAALDDVNIPSPSNGQVLAYDTTSSKWLATTLSGSYVLPVATSSVLGGIKIGYSASNQNIPVQLSSERAYVALTKSAIEHVLTGSIDTHNHPVATSSLLGMVKTGYTETGSKIPLSIHDDRGYVELTKSAIESVLTGTITSHSHEGAGGLDIENKGTSTTLQFDMSDNKLFLVTASGNRSIYINNVATTGARTIMIQIQTTSTTNYELTWYYGTSGTTVVPYTSWQDEKPLINLHNKFVYLITITNVGTGINNLRISYTRYYK